MKFIHAAKRVLLFPLIVGLAPGVHLDFFIWEHGQSPDWTPAA
jgi:hypothetical protein